jgi:SagB-type dehydrogenase family enzyme
MNKLKMLGTLLLTASLQATAGETQAVRKLPPPQLKGSASLEEALQARRSVRDFSRSPLALEQIAQLAWAAQGVTHRQGFRTAPSAGALYPLELYLLADRVSGLEPGIYHYLPARHALQQIAGGDYTKELAGAGYNQGALRQAAAVFIITGVKQRTERKYGRRAERYVLIEAGHAGQNLLLQATALGLGSVVIGAFHDASVSRVLGLEKSHQPISLLAVGVPRKVR